MVVAPHVDWLARTIGEEVDVEVSVHLFVGPGCIALMVSDDIVRDSVCCLCLLSHVGRVSLAPAKSRKSNTRPF
jgi:hypothetical protein